MKFLWIYKYSSSYNIDKWFHLDYVRWMRNNGYDVVAYGPDIHIEYPDLVQIHWDPNMKWEILLSKIKPDAVILNTKSRMFDYYSPHTGVATGSILPKGFEISRHIPKIIIEEDYHYEKDDSWYVDIGLNLIFQRHYSQYLRPHNTIKDWLPFSVDPLVFNPGNIRRNRKLCFVGSMSQAYPERKIICDSLKKHNLIDVFGSHNKIGYAYIACLQSYVAHLSTGSLYQITAAKNFEIMSSGSLLLTTDFPGLNLLFPKNTHVVLPTTEIELVQLVQNVLSKDSMINEMVFNGLRCIQEKHTHRIRTEYMLERIKKIC